MKPRDVLAILRLEDGRRWLDAAHDWQRDDALAVLEGERPYSFITRSRGSSKTTDLSAICLSAVVAAPDRLRAYWLASDADQARLAVDSIAGFVARTPSLEERVDVQARRVTVADSGAELTILPADAAGTWGLTPHLVVADELANWADVPGANRLWEAASSAVAKRSDARLVVLTTASSPDHFSFRILEHARGSSLWRTSEREGPSPWMSADRLEEQRQRLPQAVFEQLFENRWTPAEGSFLDPAVVAAAFCLEGPAAAAQPGVRDYVAGLDIGTVNDRTVLPVGHREGDRVLLDVMRSWQGSRRRPVDFAEVEAAILEAHHRFRFWLRLDPWQGLDLAQRLRARGVWAKEYTFSAASKQRLAATLLSSMNAGNLHLYPAEGLRDELLALRLVQASSGAWSFDHKRGGHDDRVVALALMATALFELPASTGEATYARGGGPGLVGSKFFEELDGRPSLGRPGWVDPDRPDRGGVPGPRSISAGIMGEQF